MNGRIEPGNDGPAARPQTAAAPPYFTWASARANITPDTVSTTPAKRPPSNGRSGASVSSLRSMIVVAPSALRYSPSAGRPVAATTLKPSLARIATATEPTPPAAPVTSTSPEAGFTPCFSSAITQSIDVYPAVPIAIARLVEIAAGSFTSQSPFTRALVA